ncbi:MAG: hypothetical protein COA42_14990 [Alteromonadaceae bacterium]|nr:MAG: hypothetical protein COA42_14990 [Alteromonadaceae bacterium]
MINKLFICLSLLMASQSLYAEAISGQAFANRSSPHALSNSHLAVFYPGQSIDIVVSGRIDINQRPRSRRKCGFLGIGCKTIRWTEHHFHNAEEVPVQFSVREVGSDTIVSTIVIQGQGMITVPASIQRFATPYELIAKVGADSYYIDHSRSAGNFAVQLVVSSNSRLPLFDQLLTQKILANRLTDDPNLIDVHTQAAHARAIAGKLRQYAKRFYPASVDINKADHLNILSKAKELAPNDLANDIAMADYYEVIGLPNEAEQTRMEAIRALQVVYEQDGSSAAARQLAQQYQAMANTILSLNGGIDKNSYLRADSYLNLAISAFRDANQVAALSNALVQRANLLRGARGVEALSTATKLLEEVRAITPISLDADIVIPGKQDNQFWAGKIRSAIVWDKIGDDKPYSVVSHANEDFKIANWDAVSEKVLVKRGQSLFWAAIGQAEHQWQYVGGIANTASIMKSTAGYSLLWDNDSKETYIIGPGNTNLKIKVGGESVCKAGIDRHLQVQMNWSMPGNQTPKPPEVLMPMAVSVADNGRYLVAGCLQNIVVYKIESSRLRRVFSHTLTGDEGEIVALALAEDGNTVGLIRRKLHREQGGPVKNVVETVQTFDRSSPQTVVTVSKFDNVAMALGGFGGGFGGGLGIGAAGSKKQVSQSHLVMSMFFTQLANSPALVLSNIKGVGIYNAESGEIIKQVNIEAAPAQQRDGRQPFAYGVQNIIQRPPVFPISKEKMIIPSGKSMQIYDSRNDVLEQFNINESYGSFSGFGGILDLESRYSIGTRKIAYLNHYLLKDGKLVSLSQSPLKVLMDNKGEIKTFGKSGQLLVSETMRYGELLFTDLNTGKASELVLNAQNNEFYLIPGSENILTINYDDQAPIPTVVSSINLTNTAGDTKKLNLPAPPLPSHDEIRAFATLNKTNQFFGQQQSSEDAIDSPEDFDKVIANPEKVLAFWVKSYGKSDNSLPLNLALFYQIDGQKIIPIHSAGPLRESLYIEFAKLRGDFMTDAPSPFRVVSSEGFFRNMDSPNGTLWGNKGNKAGYYVKDKFKVITLGDSGDVQFHEMLLSQDGNRVIIPTQNTRQTFRRSPSSSPLAPDSPMMLVLKKQGRTYKQRKCDSCNRYNKQAVGEILKERIAKESDRDYRKLLKKFNRELGIIADKDLRYVAFNANSDLIIVDTDKDKEVLAIDAAIPVHLTQDMLIARDLGGNILRIHSLSH